MEDARGSEESLERAEAILRKYCEREWAKPVSSLPDLYFRIALAVHWNSPPDLDHPSGVRALWGTNDRNGVGRLAQWRASARKGPSIEVGWVVLDRAATLLQSEQGRCVRWVRCSSRTHITRARPSKDRAPHRDLFRSDELQGQSRSWPAGAQSRCAPRMR